MRLRRFDLHLSRSTGVITEFVPPALATRGADSFATNQGDPMSSAEEGGRVSPSLTRREKLLKSLVGINNDLYTAYPDSELSLLLNEERLIAADQEQLQEGQGVAAEGPSPPYSPSVSGPRTTSGSSNGDVSPTYSAEDRLLEQMGPDMWRDPCKPGPDSD